MAADTAFFLKQLARRPTEIVALAPSSARLAREMTQGLTKGDRVAELGPGTGCITAAILACGVAPADLTLFELNSGFVGHLTDRFPRVTVLNHPAQDLGRWLPQRSLDQVVSGLPFLSMPLAVQAEILTGVFGALRPGGQFVQFTYGPVPPVAARLIGEFGLRWTASRRILWNLPPARVYRFRKG